MIFCQLQLTVEKKYTLVYFLAKLGKNGLSCTPRAPSLIPPPTLVRAPRPSNRERMTYDCRMSPTHKDVAPCVRATSRAPPRPFSANITLLAKKCDLAA